jgi:hypothetical protein
MSETIVSAGGGGPHKDNHDPNDGSDALDTANAAEISVVVAAGTGTSHSLARADHVHAINHGISDNHLLTVDGTVADDDYLKATASGVEGKTYTEAISDLLGLIIANKTSDETVNNSTTLQNDDDLLAAMATTSYYVFECYVLVTSGTTPDFKCTFTVPANATMRWKDTNAYMHDTGAGTTMSFGTDGAGWPDGVLFIGEVWTTDTAGNLQFQWAQNVADASDTKVKACSQLRLWKVT